MANTEQAPLAGKRVVVTRAAEQSPELVRALEQLGAEVLLLPAVRFSDPGDLGPLDRAIHAMRNFHWVLFTSQNAVRYFSKRWRGLGATPSSDGAPWSRLQVAAVGPVTAEAARAEGLRVDYIAREFRGEALAEELAPRLAGRSVLLPRSDRAGTGLAALLRAKGAQVIDVVAYRTDAPQAWDPGVAETIRGGKADVLAFLSPSAFHHVIDQLGIEALRAVAGPMALAVIGPTTAAAIRNVGLSVTIEARESTAAGLVRAICEHFAERLPAGGNRL